MIARRLLRIVNARTTYAMEYEEVEPFRQTEVLMLTSPIMCDLISLCGHFTSSHLLPIRMFVRPSIEAIIYDLRESSILTFDDVIEFDVLEQRITHIRSCVCEHAIWRI